MSSAVSPNALDAMIAPRSIAVVGASDDPRTINGRTIAYLKAAYRGRIFPIHPAQRRIQGLEARPTLSELDEVPDLVIVAVRAEVVTTIAEEAALLGARALLVFSSGFGEVGAEGLAAQSRLVATVREAGMRMFGPNCLGFMNIPEGVLATFAELPDPHGFRSGGLALVSQSGAFGAMAFKAAQREHIGISYFAGTGNEADLSMTELLGYFIERDDVHTVMAFGEQVADPDRFLTVAERASELDKPIIFMKVGGSEAGARAAVSHTGSMAGSDEVVEAVFRQYGVIRARRMQDLLDYARIFENRRRARGRRVAVVSISGGIGVMLADAATAAGLDVPRLEGDDLDRVEASIPSFGSATNPVDCTAQVGVSDRAALGRVLDTVAGLDAIDMVCYGGLSDVPNEDWLTAMQTLRDRTDKPAAVWCSTPEAQDLVSRRGVPCFRDPEGAMRALGALADFCLDRRDPASTRPSPTVPKVREVLASARGPVLTEPESRAVLAEYGLPAIRDILAATADEAVTAAEELGFPVACKAVSGDVPHKSDVGGVLLHLTTADAVRSAFHQIVASVRVAAPAAQVDGVLVQPMAPAGLELMIGVHRDQQFGPIVTVGMGGISTEIIHQTACRRAPASPGEMRLALRELADGRLLDNRRGLSVQQADEVATIAARVGDLAVDLDQIVEIEINPLIVHSKGIVIVDALVVRAFNPDVAAPRGP